MLAYVFPGQGSQFKGMAKDLWPRFPDLVATAERVLGYSLPRLCLDDPDGVLGQTQYTQPALFAANHLAYLHKLEETGQAPDYVAGHSLGEYNALLAAGAFDFETGLRLVRKRGELMAAATGGGMLAVLGIAAEKIRDVLQTAGSDGLELANLNTRQQTILSGSVASLQAAERPLTDAGGHVVRLRVSGAFHSRAMAQAASAFEEHMRPFELNALGIPVIANATARPYPRGKTKALLIDQLTHPVRWLDSVEYLLHHGVRRVEQIGPGSVLRSMVNQIMREHQKTSVAPAVAPA